MQYYTVYPLGGEHAITVRAPTEARARLTAAIWYLMTPHRTDVMRPIKVVPTTKPLEPYACVNDTDETLDELERAITQLVIAASPLAGAT